MTKDKCIVTHAKTDPATDRHFIMKGLAKFDPWKLMIMGQKRKITNEDNSTSQTKG